MKWAWWILQIWEDKSKGWGSSQVFLIIKTPGIYYNIITEASSGAGEDQQALQRDALSFSSWMSVLACPVHQGCLWLPAGAGGAQAGHVEWILFWMQPIVLPVPSGSEDTPQCTSAKPQGTLQPHTFLQEPYFFIHA